LRARVAWTLLVGLAVLAGCGGEDAGRRDPAPEGLRPPSIIFILTDDQAPDSLGIAGNRFVQTPHLDALAADGAYFRRAYVPTPQCAPSRASILTGRYPHAHGVMTNRDTRLSPSAHTMASALKERGYATGLVGKWHLGEDDRPQAGFEDLWVTIAAPGRYADPELWIDGERRRHAGLVTDVLTDYAIRFIDTHRDEPFFLWLAYRAPHPPFPLAPDGRFTYPTDSVPLPVSAEDDLSTKPAAQRESACHAWFARANRHDGAGLRQRLSRYYTLVSIIDHNVGRLVDAVRDRGIADQTIVIYASDNGALFGEHQMVTKGPAFYEELVRTPLIIWAPGRVPGGRQVDALASVLDIFPTVCAQAGCAVPSDLPGVDIWPLATAAASPRREALFFEYLEKSQTSERVPMRGLVTEQYKYARYLDTGEQELYDLHHDPREMDNLAADGAHRDVLTTLRGMLDAWRRTSGDVDP
jgi:N-acetylglucosamine-6-sulfatase